MTDKAEAMNVRPPAVAGVFYPAERDRLARTVDEMLDAAAMTGPAPERARAYVVPHAGYRYSGGVAAHVYAHLRAHPARRIVLVGPSHFVPLPGCAVSSASAWGTPLGPVALDAAGALDLVRAGLAEMSDAAHAREHSLEVQLPFLVRAATARPAGWTVLPVAVGQATVNQVTAVLERALLLPGPAATVLCSTDLSHYLDLATARQRDSATVEAILALDPDRIGSGDACGRHALRGLLAWAGRAGLTPRLLCQATSGDVPGGDPSRVVGYAAFSFSGTRGPG